MYKGSDWRILLPDRRSRGMVPYSDEEMDLVRCKNPDYTDDEKRTLEIEAAEAVEKAKRSGQTLTDNKLIGFSRVLPAASVVGGLLPRRDSVGIFQNSYLVFGAASNMVDKGLKYAREYGSNLGYMSTVRTTDQKSLHSTRTRATASWPGYDGLFGGGLAGDPDGDADKLVTAGVTRVTELARKRVASELGIQEKDVLDIRVLGVVEGAKYLDHTIAYDALIDRTSAELLRDKSKIPSLGKKYADIFIVDVSDPESLARHLSETRGKTLEVAKGGLVLTGANLFGMEFVAALRHLGFIEN